MIYENKHGRVEFWDEHPELNTYKNLGMNLSGGTDSAMLLFLVMRELDARKSDQIIHPMVLVDEARPTNLWNATEILLYLMDKFPNVNVAETQTEEFTKAENPSKDHWHRVFTARMREEIPINVVLHGRTANPSLDVAREHDMLKDREVTRDTGAEIEWRSGYYAFYAPFNFVDKKFVAELYKEFDLMEMFYMTASCISKAEMTNFFTEPCKTCWWCREKLWAFGCYDGGVK